MVSYSEVRQNTYFDSVTLMLFSSKLSGVAGVHEAAVMMGTDHNKSLMRGSGLLTEEAAKEITPNDLVIGIAADTQEAVEEAKALLAEQFENKKKPAGGGDGHLRAKTIESALDKLPDANFAVVSLPGRYAKSQTMKLMRQGLHVLLFSDNVTIEEENQLKDYALEHGLLMMGPDCGTAIINGVSLGFANVLRRGDIGLVAAAGTGLQEVTCVIDALGGGISQALGTGGRDVKEAVGGKMMLSCIDALDQDPGTKVIGIISKPPARAVMEKILERLEKVEKPVVACFLGAEELPDIPGVSAAATLEDAGRMLVALSQGKELAAGGALTEDQARQLDEAVKGLAPEQKYVRGLYSGGTLCYEGQLLLQKSGFEIYSNIATQEAFALKDVEKSFQNTLLDMGDDYFTDGIPHPMIDFRLRSERLRAEARDPETAVILLDCVLGYGSNEDPAGALAEAVAQSRKENEGRRVVFIASVCGTPADPQNRVEQEKKLREAGILVLPTNAQAVRAAAAVLKNR